MNMPVEVYKYMLPSIALIIAFIISKRSIPIIRLILERKKLMEKPDSPRKIHKEPVPALGGVAIFASIIITYAIVAIWLENWQLYPFLIGGLCMLFFVGLKDDLLVLSAKKKLFIQITAPALVVIGGGVYVEGFGGLFGIHELPVWIAIPFTLYIFVVIINAYNLIDGLDGLAGGVGMIVSLYCGVWFIVVGLIPHAVLSFSLTGALLGFLWYNWSPAKIFMGDTGSMVVGFIFATLIVKMIQFGMNAEYAPLQNIKPVVAMALLTVPLYDTIRVFMLRIAQKKSPFSSGTDHIHHILLNMSGTHSRSSVYLFIANIVVLTFVISLSKLPVDVLFVLTLGLCLMIFPTIGLKRRLLLKLGVLSINPDMKNGSNGSWNVKMVNGFSPLKLQLPQWEIQPNLTNGYTNQVVDNGNGKRTQEKKSDPAHLQESSVES